MKTPLALAALLLLGWLAPCPLELERPTAPAFFLAHFTHLSARHLIFSGTATVGLAAALERKLGAARTALLVLALVASVSAAVLIFERGLFADYCGASGVGYGLAAAVAVQERRRIALPVLAFLAVKIGYEFVTGKCLVDVSLAAAGAAPVPVAHAVGIAAGTLCGSVMRVPDPFHPQELDAPVLCPDAKRMG